MTDKTFRKYCLVIDEWYVNGFNGTKAYQKYYPKSSDETSSVEFNKILKIPKIESYQKEKQEGAVQTLKTSHDQLLKELENWAYSDITETISLTPDQVKELPKDIRRLITRYKHTTKRMGTEDAPIIEDVIELWFVSKERAMEMIHKHVGFYEKDNTQRTVPAINIIRD